MATKTLAIAALAATIAIGTAHAQFLAPPPVPMTPLPPAQYNFLPPVPNPTVPMQSYFQQAVPPTVLPPPPVMFVQPYSPQMRGYGR